MTLFNDVYRDKRVLVTGHTGFKGSWLSLWLTMLGAEVHGISDSELDSPSLFGLLAWDDTLKSHFVDIRDFGSLNRKIQQIKPDFIFHLAAQSIVSESFADPMGTITTNTLGTANLLECLRINDLSCTAVIITSDKCYRNDGRNRPFKESDPLGGNDLYSASKAANELFVHSYFHSFFNCSDSGIRLATARAGNVIGGGDWSLNRLIPDCIRSWCDLKPVPLRDPDGIRPWQFVLEPLSGYLLLGAGLSEDIGLNGDSFNFGPMAVGYTVRDLLEGLWSCWETTENHTPFKIVSNPEFKEDLYLRLNCDKARDKLKWSTVLSFQETLAMTGYWYSHYKDIPALELCRTQIQDYQKTAAENSAFWIQ